MVLCQNMEDELILLKGAGEKLAEMVAQISFDLWQKDNFHTLINFDQISKTEQDRIFNELELTILGFLTLNLDYALSRTLGRASQRVLKTLQEEIKIGFLNLFISLGIEDKFIQEWKTLINMRFDEYRKDYKLALKESESMKEFEGKENFRIIWARVETLTIDGLSHIRRGNVKKGDSLWRYLRRFLTELDVNFSKVTHVYVQPFARA